MSVVGDNTAVQGALPSAGPRLHRSWTPLARALAAAGDDWTLMIVLALAPGRMRLRQLQSALPGVSTGVLERYVQQMTSLGLLSRWRFREMPPRVELELTPAGLELVPIAAALSRWGLRHVWTEARERESVDIGALLHQLPVLLEESQLPDGTLEVVAGRKRDEQVRLIYSIRGGRLSMNEGEEPEITATVAGGRSAWIAALGPAGDRSGLRLSGDESLGGAVLEVLYR